MSRFCVIRTWPSSFSKILGDSRQCVASSPLLENLVEQLKAKNQRLYVLSKNKCRDYHSGIATVQEVFLRSSSFS